MWVCIKMLIFEHLTLKCNNMKNRYSWFLCLACALCFVWEGQLAAQTHTQKTDLPTIYIDTEGGQQITSKDNYIYSTLYYVDETGEKQYDQVQIRGRGNSTWGLAKKPYRLKFSSKEKFLGNDHANAKSWTLLANFADKTLIRNAVAACIGKFAGQPFTASVQFVDLVLNGTYLGNYQVSDQMEIRKKRVDITEQDEPMTEESNITGGYFLEVDGFAQSEPVYYRTKKGIMVTIKSPDEEIIAPAQINYIKNHMQLFEDALFADNFTDPENGYRQYVDSLTLASWYISTELTGNVDGFWSTYMYKEKDDDKFYWGPLWDYDIAFNNCDRVGDVSRRLMVGDAGFGSDLTKIWILRMWQDPWFVRLINRTWQECVERGLEEHVMAYIDSISSVIDRSQQLNFARWPINQHVYNELVLFSTYKEGVDYLKSFLHKHIAYLTETFAQAESGEGDVPLPTPVFYSDTRYYYRIFNKGNGKAVDVSDGVCIWDNIAESEAQQWDIVPAGDYFRIVNRENGLALCDNAEWANGNYQTGIQLGLQELDETDNRQLWSLIPVNTGNCYVVVNRQTNLAWNNANGRDSNGNAVISWTNDASNAQKDTRQWHFVKDEQKPEEPKDPEVPEEPEDPENPENPENPDDDPTSIVQPSVQYMVTYDPQAQQLHFVTDDVDKLKGQVSLYDLSGTCLLTSPIKHTIDVAALPGDVYVLTWTEGGVTRSLKFKK